MYVQNPGKFGGPWGQMYVQNLGDSVGWYKSKSGGIRRAIASWLDGCHGQVDSHASQFAINSSPLLEGYFWTR